MPIPLKALDAGRLTGWLEAKVGGIKAYWDEGTATLYIQGRAEQVRQARAIIERIDVRTHRYLFSPPRGHAACVAVGLQLALPVAACLGGRLDRALVEVVGIGQSLLVDGTAEDIELVGRIMSWLRWPGE